ncbi:MAG: hypothetical protein B7Z70_03765 [Acidithiobacillus ferrivorans]|uniref:Uncharacterized protein n=1 Tax=Acidithiobacillus ferrivorans TaxID=160808 RepID=A0A257TBC0_9PROT|nr:MAG: hypothetical protein B7Z70_03765 [Acidithiobacillus ferrivorans]
MLTGKIFMTNRRHNSFFEGIGIRSMFIVIFAALGGGVAYLLRPAVPLIGQLPVSIVMTDGKNLHGLERLAQPYAQQSLEYLIAGVVIGGMLGIIASYLYALTQDDDRRHRTPPKP